MDFNKLDEHTKKSLHEEFSNYAKLMGGENFFLNIVEEIRALKPSGLLNTSGTFHTKKAKISLNKAIYKETLSSLLDAIRKEEKDGDILDGLNPKEYKTTMNIIRTLKPVTITFVSKEDENSSFTFSILDTSIEKKTKVTFAFKAIFFYHLDEIKKVLFYKAK